jgi:aspartate/methionine/tyrosine aminotransferase
MDTINFTRGVPANESFPTAELIDAATAVLTSHGAQMLQYGPSRGFEPLRQWLAEWQRVPVDRVITSNGSLQLIEFLCLHLIRPAISSSPSRPATTARSGCCVVTARGSSAFRVRPTDRTSRRSSARSKKACPSSSI